MIEIFGTEVAGSARTALKWKGHEIAFSALDESVERAAHQLAAARQGRVLHLATQSQPDFVVLILAALKSECPVIVDQAIPMLDPFTTCKQDLSTIAVNFTSSAALRFASKVTWISGLPRHPEARLILRTSGSGGKPRYVQLSRENLEAALSAITASLGFSTVGTQTLFMPLSYSFGLLGQLLPALRCGVTTCLFESFTGLSLFLETGKPCGMISGIASHFRALLKAANGKIHDQVTHVVLAGAAVDCELRKQLVELFPRATVFVNYGQTEASPRILSISSKHPRFLQARPNFVSGGYAIGAWQLSTENHELIVRGPQTMLGYLGEEPRALNSWMHTGDLGEIDDDGLVWLRGRKDDLVKFRGLRMSLAEIESAALAHPRVEEACAFLEGDDLILIVNARSLTPIELSKSLRACLPAEKNPSRILFTTTWPQTASGKTDRLMLWRSLISI